MSFFWGTISYMHYNAVSWSEASRSSMSLADDISMPSGATLRLSKRSASDAAPCVPYLHCCREYCNHAHASKNMKCTSMTVRIPNSPRWKLNTVEYAVLARDINTPTHAA